MSDEKRRQYYPHGSELAEFGFRPCLVCGANINSAYLGLHVEWHEREGLE